MSAIGLINVFVNGILLGCVYALFSLGLNLIFGVMKIVNFAQGEFVMLGMYFGFFIWYLLDIDPYLSAPLTVLFFFAFGIVIYRVLTKYIIGKRDEVQILATIGLGLIIANLSLIFFTADHRLIQLNLPQISIPGAFFIRTEMTIAAALSVTCTVITFLFLSRTKLGKMLRATSQDRVAAQSLGINPHRMYAIAWGISSALVGVAGALFVTYYAVSPFVSPTLGLISFVVVVLGGLGDLEGGLAAGIFIGAVEIASGYLLSAMLRYFVVYVIFVLTLLFSPQGIGGFLRKIRIRKART